MGNKGNKENENCLDSMDERMTFRLATDKTVAGRERTEINK